MTLSSPSREIKNQRRQPRRLPRLVVGGVLALLLGTASGCVVVGEARFSTRPDSTDRGDLLGPLTGRVVDVATKKPVGAAYVVAIWRVEQPGKVGPRTIHQATRTNADGRYYLPRLASAPTYPARIADLTLYVYQPGYIAYRSDRYFEDNAERRDFAQEDAVIGMQRLASNVSRVQHLAFLDPAAGLLGSILDKERYEANQERTGEIERGPKEGLLDASTLLSLEELRAVTGYNGAVALERLGDIEQSPTYDSRHFRAEGRPESFDVAYRVFRPRTESEAVERYQALLKKTPNAEERDEVADRSMRGSEGPILAAGALDKENRLVILLTCGQSQCRDQSQVVAILRRLMERYERLDKVDKGTGAADKKPDSDGDAP